MGNIPEYPFAEGGYNSKVIVAETMRSWPLAVITGANFLMPKQAPKEQLKYLEDNFGLNPNDAKIEYYDNEDPETYLDIINKLPPKSLHILHPYDCIDPAVCAVEPDMLFELNSKASIKGITEHTPNKKILPLEEILSGNEELLNNPYVLKKITGAAGDGVKIIYNPEEGVSPEDSFLVGEEELIVEELINVKNNFNIQFFIDKDKSIYCIGYGIQITTDDGEYEGTICFLNNDPNPKLLEVTNDACANIAERGYFGFLGFDVLEDDNGDYYIVDANIRINGSTSVHLIKDKLLPKLGDYAYMTSFDLGAESPTEAIEKISEYGILLSLSHKEQGKYKAFAMFAVETNKPEDAISKVNEFLEANK